MSGCKLAITVQEGDVGIVVHSSPKLCFICHSSQNGKQYYKYIEKK